jgi:hypothetical protein
MGQSIILPFSPTFPSSLRVSVSSLKSTTRHGVVFKLSNEVYTFTGQHGPSLRLFAFSYLSVLVSEPHRRALCLTNTHQTQVFILSTPFCSFLTYPDPYPIQSRRPFHERVCILRVFHSLRESSVSFPPTVYDAFHAYLTCIPH